MNRKLHTSLMSPLMPHVAIMHARISELFNMTQSKHILDLMQMYILQSIVDITLGRSRLQRSNSNIY